ncbi:hypothetical protein N665_0339s0063 [Sinapis alba]|nr:hypothetical protein N665_0339s0063 [Sinapis alba]
MAIGNQTENTKFVRKRRRKLPSLSLSSQSFVRKTRSQQYVENDATTTQQSIADLQAQITNLVAAVATLTTQQNAPAQLHPRNDHVSLHNDSDDDNNPFAPLRQHHTRRRTNNAYHSDSDNELDDSSWKSSFKIDFPEFNGSTMAEELLDWFITVEEILDFKKIPLDRCVPLIAIRF